MGKIIAKRDTPTQCFARLGLNNGDQIATSGVKVFKMWAGIFPAATLWKSDSISHVFKTFYDEPKDFRRPLDSMIDKLIDCDSAAEVIVRLAPQ